MNRDNYFAWQAFGRAIRQGEGAPLPPYLQRANWDAMKERVEWLDCDTRHMLGWIGGREEASNGPFSSCWMHRTG